MVCVTPWMPRDPDNRWIIRRCIWKEDEGIGLSLQIISKTFGGDG
jgi:hypothetical protein